MKKIIYLLPLIFAGTIAGSGCNDSNANSPIQTVSVPADQPAIPDSVYATAPFLMSGAFALDTAESRVGWQASYIAGGGHAGRISPISGQVVLSDAGTIQAGDFVINMLSIKNVDIPDLKSRKDLEEHLKSDDFFSAARFPQAYFKIGSVKPAAQEGMYVIEGPLTIKGVTHPVSFNTKVHREGNMVETMGELVIDRTKWRINHEAGSVFNGFKDAVISGRVKISLNLVFWQGKPGQRKNKTGKKGDGC